MDVENLKAVFEELQKDTLETELIQDNKLPFEYQGVSYRVKMPTQKENASATTFKNKNYVRLLQEDNTLTIKQLTKLLKEKQGIDIAKLDEQADEIEAKLIQAYLTLSKKTDTDIKGIEADKIKIDELREERLKFVMEKAELMSPAIEHQAQDNYYRFLTALCAERCVREQEKEQINETWVKVWNTFEDYENDNSTLPYVILGKMTEIVMSV